MASGVMESVIELLVSAFVSSLAEDGTFKVGVLRQRCGIERLVLKERLPTRKQPSLEQHRSETKSAAVGLRWTTDTRTVAALRSMPASQGCCDLVDRQLSARHGHHELIGRVVGRVEVHVVEAAEHDDGEPPQSLVAVDQCLVADQ